MAYCDLAAFLAGLEEMGELCRVPVEVDPLLEIAEITDRVSKQESGGKALWFERVKGSAFPVITNIFGSKRRMCAALGIAELSEMEKKMDDLLKSPPLPFPPKRVEVAPCQEVMEDEPDLFSYPFIKCSPDDGPAGEGRAITLPLVFTEDPDTGEPNCGIYRVGIFDRKSAGIHWKSGSGGARHYAKYVKRGERMPVAIALGGPPSLVYAASVSLPAPFDEMSLAGFLMNKAIEVVRCEGSGLMVPAFAEMIIEGWLEPGNTRPGGAFGNHTGFYAPVGEVPVFRVATITRKRRPLFPATVTGRPPMENCWMAKATERLLLPLLRRDMPEIAEINLLLEGIFHNCAIVSIKKCRPGQGRELLTMLRRRPEMQGARLLVVVDADADVGDISYIGWRVLNNVDWRRDLVITGRTADAAPPLPYVGSGMGIDATRKLEEEMMGGKWPQEVAKERRVAALVEKRWREYGL